MKFTEEDYIVSYEPTTGDAIVFKKGKQLMHMCMDTELSKKDVLNAFRELLVGINAVQ